MFKVRDERRVEGREFQTVGAAIWNEWLPLQGFGLSDEQMKTAVKLTYEGSEYSLSHGSVVIAAITSCTNTSNPSVMLGAGRYCRLHIWTYMSTVTIIICIIYGHILCNWTVSAQACFFSHLSIHFVRRCCIYKFYISWMAWIILIKTDREWPLALTGDLIRLFSGHDGWLQVFCLRKPWRLV